MTDQLLIEIDSHLHVVVCWGGESGSHPFAGEGEGQAGSPMLQGQRAVLELHRRCI